MLDDVRVLSFTHFLQGPSASQLLGDLGADVIKVEPLAGAFERHWSAPDAYLGGESVFFLLAGRNQRSLAIDLRAQEGRQVIHDLIPRTDVVLESFRPGAMDRLGLGYEALSALNPALVYCSLSGYGPDGPYAGRPGQDMLVQALSGLAMLNGGAGDGVVPVGASVVDQHSAVLATAGVLAALYDRRSSGQGRRIDCNLLAAALDLQIEPFHYHLNGFPGTRSESGISSRFYRAPYGVFDTADGHIGLSITSADKLAVLFGDEWFRAVSREDEFARRDEVNARIARHLAKDTTERWSAACAEHGVWYAPVNDYDAVMSDPQVAWNDTIATITHPRAGEIRLVKHPLRYDGRRPDVGRLPPAIGEHTAEVLAEAGYDVARVQQLRDAGVIRDAEPAER